MAENDRININQSSLEQLSAVPGVGPALAQRIIDSRPYAHVNELVRVKGIGESSLERLLPKLTVDPVAEDLHMDVHVSTEGDSGLDEPFEIVETEVFAPEEMTPQELDNESHFEQSDVIENRFSAKQEKQIDDVLKENDSEVSAEPLFSRTSNIKDDKKQSDWDLKEEVKVGAQTKKSETSSIPVEIKSSTVHSENNELVTRSQLWWSVAGTAIITVFLTILITLGILAVLNGGLQYASTAKAYSLENSIITMGDRTDSIQVQIDGMRDRLDTLETVATRVSKLEQTTQELQTMITENKNALETISITIGEMQQQIDLLQVAAQKSQDLRNGLLDLLINIEGLPVSEGK